MVGQDRCRNPESAERIEAELKEIKSVLGRSQKIAHLGSWELSVETGQMTWSDEAFRILGLEPSEQSLNFERWLAFIHPDDREMVMLFLMDRHEDMTSSKSDFRIVARDGQVKHLHMEWNVECDERGIPLRVFGVSQDVTELRRTEAELKEAKAQGELYLDLMSHDINNMNHVAMGYLEYALDLIYSGKSIGKENRLYLEKPLKALKSSLRLIDNVSKVRMEKEGAYRHELIDVGKMLEGVREELAGVNGREINIDLKVGSSCHVRANELLKDVFLNLVGNAIKHSDPRKPLTVNIVADKTTDYGGKCCRVAVEDDGPGIPDDLKAGLRERMSHDKPKTIGKGFGLYLASMLAKDYGGSVAMEDRVPGDYSQGSRFVVRLPAADRP